MSRFERKPIIYYRYFILPTRKIKEITKIEEKMKKIFICISILAALFFALCACTNAKTDRNTTTEKGAQEKVTTEEVVAESTTEEATTEEITTEEITTEEITTEEVTTEEITEVETENEDEKYKEIKCRAAGGYEQFFFSFKDESYALSVVMPKEWSFTKSNSSTYLIKRGSEVIGKAVSGSDGVSDTWISVRENKATYSDPVLTSYIERSGSGETLKFRYRFHYAFEIGGVQRELCITVDYAELTALAEQKIRMFSSVKEFATDPGYDLLKGAPIDRGILIVGNSFVGSSNIGNILLEMLNLNGKDVHIRWISRGYAHVDTYANDTELIGEIYSGRYGIVFVCGYYSSDQSEHLWVIEDACSASDSALVMFPAHNESRNAITHTQSEHQGIVCLDWKAELDALIEQGVDKWDLCYDDDHLHSTPLAGYVGAHMIYRAIYGENPRGSMSSSISQQQIKAILGKYGATGIVYSADEDHIIIFEK